MNKDGINPRYKPFIKENMTSDDYRTLGMIIMSDKYAEFKLKIRRVLKLDKKNKKTKND